METDGRPERGGLVVQQFLAKCRKSMEDEVSEDLRQATGRFVRLAKEHGHPQSKPSQSSPAFLPLAPGG